MTPSTRGSQPQHSRSNHQRAGCPETGTSGSGRRSPEKDPLPAGTSPAAYRHPAASLRGSSAITSASSTATRRSPGASERPTAGSRCECRRTWSGPSAPATGNTANRGTGPGLQNLDDYGIVRTYGAEFRGVVNYYLLAQDVSRLHDLQWNAETSMLKTLGAKHRSTVTKMAARHKAKIETSDGPRTCFEARKHREGRKDLVARFGGIILRQNRRAVITDPAPGPPLYPRKELTRRLHKRECELCEAGTPVAVHQVTGLRELGKPGPGQPAWAALMARMRRKTLIVCEPCHDWIH